MFKLIKKDFFAFSYILFFQLLIIIAFLSFSFFFDNNGSMALIIVVMYPMTLPTILLLNDQNYTTLICSLPVSRTDYVLAKYIGGGLFASALMGIGMLYGYIITEYVVSSPIPFQQLFSLKGLSFLMLPIILLNSITFPVFFAFSKQKGSMLMMIIFILLLLTIVIGFVYIEKNLEAPYNYDKASIFPVIMMRLETYIHTVGKSIFTLQLFSTALGLLCSSTAISLLVFRHKDIGQTL